MDCTVVIPCGPGHEGLAPFALQSVRLAVRESLGPFARVHAVVADDTQGEMGRSVARNLAVKGPADDPRLVVVGPADSPEEAFESEWLFFLDADDLMCSDAVWGQSPFKTVAGEIERYDAIWGSIHELNRDGKTVDKRKQVERITTYRAFVHLQPYLAVQIGHFLKRECFEGFDPELDICEDIAHYLYCWRELKCVKLSTALFLNRRGHHTWMLAGNETRGGTGREWSIRAQAMMSEARKALDLL